MANFFRFLYTRAFPKNTKRRALSLRTSCSPASLSWWPIQADLLNLPRHLQFSYYLLYFASIPCRNINHLNTITCKMTIASYRTIRVCSGVTRGGGMGTAPGDTRQGGDTRRKIIFLWANLQRIVEKRGRTGVGWHPGGVTPEWKQ